MAALQHCVPKRAFAPSRRRATLLLLFLLPPLAWGWLISVAFDAAPNLLPQQIRISSSADPNGSIWREYDPYLDDFVVFYAAGNIARRSAGDLYDVDAVHAEEASVIDAHPTEVIRLPFFNPPPYVAPFAALSLLKPAAAAALWTLAGLVALSAVLALLWRRAVRRDRVLLTASAALVVSMPFHEVILHGQITLFLIAAWLAVYLGAIDGNRPWLATAGLVLLTIKPQLALVPLGYLLLTQNWTVLGRYLLAETGLVLAGALVLGVGVYLDWLLLMLEATGWEDSNGIWIHAMFGWNAFVRALVGPGFEEARVLLTALLLVGTVAFVGHQARRGLQPANTLALLVMASVLVSPHLFAQDLLLLGLPLLVLVGLNEDREVWAAYGAAGWLLTYLHFSHLLPAPDENGINLVTLWVAAGLLLATIPAPALARGARRWMSARPIQHEARP